MIQIFYFPSNIASHSTYLFCFLWPRFLFSFATLLSFNLSFLHPLSFRPVQYFSRHSVTASHRLQIHSARLHPGHISLSHSRDVLDTNISSNFPWLQSCVFSSTTLRDSCLLSHKQFKHLSRLINLLFILFLTLATSNSPTGQLSTPTLTNYDLPMTVYSKDAILSRRCSACLQRIFTESEESVIAQSQLFHTTCFCCAICNTCLDVTNYCFHVDHEKFYCIYHYHEVTRADEQLGINVQKNTTGVGPGAFAGQCPRHGIEYVKTECRSKLVLPNCVLCL